MIRLIAAVDQKRGIAKHGILPWYIPEDERYFTTKTKLFGGQVLTGGITFRNTYHGRPLVDRKNFILTRDTKTNIDGATVINNLSKFLENFANKDLWVAGGAAVFDQVFTLGKADELYLTHIDADFGCDQFFPEFEENFKLIEQSEMHEQNGFRFIYSKYARIN